MKTVTSYSSKMKFAVINEWNRTHNIVQARQAACNIPAKITCYKWIQQATQSEPAVNSVRYTKAFKKKAVRMYYRKGRNARQTAKALGVHPTSIRYWVKSVSI